MILEFSLIIFIWLFYILYLLLSRSCNRFLFWYLQYVFKQKASGTFLVSWFTSHLFLTKRFLQKIDLSCDNKKSPCLSSLSGQHRDEIHYVAYLCPGIIFVLKMYLYCFSSKLAIISWAWAASTPFASIHPVRPRTNL